MHRLQNFTFQYVSINTLLRGHFGVISPDFTFQYVSINTYSLVLIASDYRTLHSNMFLLIQLVIDEQAKQFNFTFQYVSINTGIRRVS